MKRGVIFLSILFFSVISADLVHAVPADVEAKSEYILADKLFNEKNYVGAIEHANNAKTLLGQTNSKIEYLLVKAYHAQESYEKAFAAIEKFFSISTDSGNDQYNEMVVLYAEIKMKQEQAERKQKKKQEQAERKKKEEQEQAERNKGGLIDNGNGTVSDPRTGLMWAAKDNGSDIEWADAKAYCESYRVGGYTDWRMPTQNELAGLYNPNITNRHGYHLSWLIDLKGGCPWASETRGSEAAYFHFYVGGLGWSEQSNSIGHRALPVCRGN